MEQAVNKLKEKANEEEISEIMEQFIDEIKSICKDVHAPIAGTDPKKVLHAIGDPYGLALRPQTEEIENKLELVMPDEGIMELLELLQRIGNIDPISDKAKGTLLAMMDHTAEAYYRVAQAAEQFTQIAHECSTQQLMLIMKYAVRPIIHIESNIGMEHEVTEKEERLSTRYNKKGEPDATPKPNGRVTQTRTKDIAHKIAGRNSLLLGMQKLQRWLHTDAGCQHF